tara:strand:- start:35 stop:859 length:825 start_codon:yes stop_codon:yes gene_type:complete
MKLKLIIIIFLIILTNCSKEKKEVIIIEENLEEQMMSAYNEGFQLLEEGDNLLAAKKFNDAEIFFPQSAWAPKSVLMAAYSYYSQNYYSDAILEIDRFLEKYPENKNSNYAHYMKAICYFEQAKDEKKDFEPIKGAKIGFEFIINNYPESDFALDSTYKLDLINSILASKEMYIGRYYMDRKKWVAAINRFKYVIENYDTTVYSAEALHRLVELYFQIGFIDESKKYANILGYNYQSNQWYKETYKIYNADYKDPIKEIKKEKKGLLKKFKSLF